MQPLLTIVIATDHHLTGVNRLLEALDAQVDVALDRLEVVVVVDGCNNSERNDHLKTSRISLRVLRQPKAGQASARNAAWSAGRGMLTLFLAGDLQPNPKLVAAHLAEHAKHPGYVVLGPVVGGEPQQPWVDYMSWVQERKFCGLGTAELPSGINDGANFSLPTKLLLQVGGFDSKLPVQHEVDLGYRLAAAGTSFAVAGGAIAVRSTQLTLADWSSRQRIKGRFDAYAFATRPYQGGLLGLIACFYDRHVLNRQLLRFTLGSRGREEAVWRLTAEIGTWLFRAHLRGASRWAFSAAANVLYWGGVRDGLRRTGGFWDLVHQARNCVERPYRLLTPPATI